MPMGSTILSPITRTRGRMRAMLTCGAALVALVTAPAVQAQSMPQTPGVTVNLDALSPLGTPQTVPDLLSPNGSAIMAPRIADMPMAAANQDGLLPAPAKAPRSRLLVATPSSPYAAADDGYRPLNGQQPYGYDDTETVVIGGATMPGQTVSVTVNEPSFQQAEAAPVQLRPMVSPVAPQVRRVAAAPAIKPKPAPAPAPVPVRQQPPMVEVASTEAPQPVSVPAPEPEAAPQVAEDAVAPSQTDALPTPASPAPSSVPVAPPPVAEAVPVQADPVLAPVPATVAEAPAMQSDSVPLAPLTAADMAPPPPAPPMVELPPAPVPAEAPTALAEAIELAPAPEVAAEQPAPALPPAVTQAEATPEPPALPVITPPQAVAPETQIASVQPKAPATPRPAASTDGGMTIAFATDTAELVDDATVTLDHIVDQLKASEASTVRISAYADGGEGGASRARRLSLSRALTVRSYLLEKGIQSNRIEVRALGVPDDGMPLDRVDLAILSAS